MSFKRLFSLPILVVCLLLGVAFSFLLLKNKQDNTDFSELGFYAFDQARSIQAVRLMGLDGQEKNPLDSVSGKWTLVNFGYISCPDICPINLGFLAELKYSWLQENPDRQLEILHITFDPERDTVENLNLYLSYFDESIKGFTGDLQEIRKIATQFNMVFIHEPADEEGNYLVSHSDSIGLMNPKGEYVGLFKGPYRKETAFEVLSFFTE